MLEFLQKFNNLPPELKRKISSPKVMVELEELEKNYGLALAALIMRVMVKEVPLDSLADELLKEKLAPAKANALAGELKNRIFFSFNDYFAPIAPAVFSPKPRPTVSRQSSEPAKGASFFFSPEDEAEIRELAKKFESDERLPPASLEEKLESIIARAKINFGSADLADRFKQILKTYLRGIRNRLETRATLVKPFVNGGLSFDTDSAEQVMTLADKIIKGQASAAEASPAAKIKSPIAAVKPELTRDADYDFSRLVKKPAPTVKAELKSEKLDVAHELAPLVPIVKAGQAELKSATVRQAKKEEKSVAAPPAPETKTQVEIKPASKPALVPSAESQVEAKPATKPAAVPAPASKPADDGRSPLIRRRFQAENLNQSPKVKLADVKYVPRVMSPLDELKYMDLVNFRRLDNDPAATAQKIKDKIDLLAEENYAKKLEGIKFWRQSPLNKMYLEIGHLSISENKPVSVIIKERREKNFDSLSEDEFKAILELNKSLRF